MTTLEKTAPTVTVSVGTGSNRNVLLADSSTGLRANVTYKDSDGKTCKASVAVSEKLTAQEQTDLDAILAKLEVSAVTDDGFAAQ